MNETVNKFLLAGNKFIPEMHSRQPDLKFTYSACGPFPKSKKKNQRNRRFMFIKTICIKLAFNIIWRMDLPKRTVSDKALHDKAKTSCFDGL